MSRRTVSASYTRLANTTAYTAGDALSNNTTGQTVLTFENCAAMPGGWAKIVNALMIDDSVPGTPGDFELWLFSASPTAPVDNVAMVVTDAEALTLVGIIPFTVEHASTLNEVYMADQTFLPLPFQCGSTDNLFGMVKVLNGYTPASGGVLTWTLIIEGI